MSEKYGVDLPWHLTQDPDVEPSYEELADYIAELEAEIDDKDAECIQLRSECNMLRAENARLRETLRSIDEQSRRGVGCGSIARDALQEGEG